MNEKAKRHTTTITAELQERLNWLVPGEPRLNGQIKKMARELELHRMTERDLVATEPKQEETK